MKLTKIYTIVFGLYPILNIYSSGIPSLSIGEFFLLILLFLFYSKNNVVLVDELNKVRQYLFYVLIVSLMALWLIPWTRITDCIYDSASLLMNMAILYLSVPLINYSLLKTVIIKLSIYSVIFLFIQNLLFQLSGTFISGIIPFLSLTNLVSTDMFILSQSVRDRFSSFFEEPAHLSQFLSIALILMIWSERINVKYRKILLIAVSFSILLSQSANGYVLLILVWGFYGLKKFGIHYFMKHKFHFCFILCVLAIISYFLYMNEKVQTVFLRVNEFSLSPEATEHGFSTFIRTLRGYILWYELPVFQKILGTGIGSIMPYVDSHPNTLYLQITSHIPNYVNSIQYILISSGIVGGILFGRFLYFLFKNNSSLGKSVIISFLALCCSSGVLMSYTFPYMIIISVLEYKNQLQNKFQSK